MRRILATLAAAALLAVAVAVPATAITDGALDGNGHPYVGLMVAKDAAGNPLWRCSGTMISPKVFLTAGHCTEAPAAKATIWFEAGPVGTSDGYPLGGTTSHNGTTYLHPLFDPNQFFYRDLGIVVLDQAVTLSQYGALPAKDQLDTLKTKRGTQDVTFTAVGYGLQMAFPDAAAWKESKVKVRMVAHPKLNQINVPGFTGDFSLLLSNNANTGGTCFGDSGGPNFLGDSNIVAGVTSFGMNSTCAGTGGVFRVDRSWSLNWINDMLVANP